MMIDSNNLDSDEEINLPASLSIRFPSSIDLSTLTHLHHPHLGKNDIIVLEYALVSYSSNVIRQEKLCPCVGHACGIGIWAVAKDNRSSH